MFFDVRLLLGGLSVLIGIALSAIYLWGGIIGVR